MKIFWNECDMAPPTQTLLKQVVSAGLKKHPVYHKTDCEVNISFVTPAEMADLNQAYRGKNTPTDVLSFPNDGAQAMPAGPTGRPKRHSPSQPAINLGDIIICTDVAQAQAAEYGHSLERELAFLTAHGLLHLIGYDHHTPQAEAEMIAMQKEILAWVGAGK
ncbi:MAG: rRNA maturation RNase YbeY [Defluviitaleaceae bacterium]|nr:rRNA maturation RNase YbeY [Defluviitaleaceae bacterium]